MLSSRLTAAAFAVLVVSAAPAFAAPKNPKQNAASSVKVPQVSASNSQSDDSARDFILVEASRKAAAKPKTAAAGKRPIRVATAKSRTAPLQAKAEKSEKVAPVAEGRAAAIDIPQTRVERSARAAAAPSGSQPLRAMVARHAAANGVPLSLAHGVVMVESRYNARATGPGGYIGLMQLSYRTARGMGYSGSRAGLYDPETNLRYGMKYLGGALRLAGGSTCGAVSKYQGGHGVKGVTRAGSVYCAKVRKHIAAMPAAPKSEQLASIAPRS